MKKIVKVPLSWRGVRAVRRFSRANDMIARYKLERIASEVLIRNELGEAEVGTFEGLDIVKVVHSSNSHYDSDVLKLKYPQAEKDAKVETAYTYLKVV